MDLSDGSDVEGEVDLDLNEENALLGSDDEDSNRLIYDDELDYNEDALQPNEDGDVLDLALNDDEGLGFNESDSQRQNRVAPIKVRASAVPSHVGSSSYGSSTSARNDGEDDEDEDDDSRNIRSRFLSERNTEDINSQSNSMQSSMGNPIQTLGSRTSQAGDGRPKQQWNNNRPQPQRFNNPPRFPMNRSALLGEGPRPNHAQVRGTRPQSGPPVQQFQGNLFTDFAKPMRPGPHQQQGNQVRGMRPGCFPNDGINVGGRPPGMMMRGNRGPMNGPNFPHPMRPRGNPPRPGNMQHNRPPGNWRNNRPDMRPNFQGPPNPMGMGGMGLMQPPGPIYSQEPRPPFFLEQGVRPDLNPHFNPNVATVQPMQQHMFPNGPLLGSGPQPPRIHHVRPEMQPPVQPVQPFFPAPHAQPYLEEPHPHQHMPQGQGYWPHPNHGGDPNGWGNGPPNYPGPPIQGGAPPVAIRMPPPVEQVMPHHHQQQPHHFNEGPPQMNVPPRNMYEDQSRPQQPYYEQQPPHQEQQQRYPSHQEEHRSSHSSSYDHSSHLNHSNRRDDYRHDYEYERSHRDDSRYHSKRKYDYSDEEPFSSRSPEKRLNGRLGPPVKHDTSSPVKDQKSEELLKIREETKKTMGLDDDYIKKLEEQKQLREQILRKKAEARKKFTGEGNDKAGESEVSSSTSRPSIYINPKAFRGDLSALNLANVNVIKGSSSGGGGNVKGPTSVGNFAKNVVATVPKTTATSSVTTTKPRTILKIIKDKHGNVISRSKVIVVPKQKKDGRSATTN